MTQIIFRAAGDTLTKIILANYARQAPVLAIAHMPEVLLLFSTTREAYNHKTIAANQRQLQFIKAQCGWTTA